MIRLAHIVKIVGAKPGSEWDIAQPVTFASMRAARDFSKSDIGVRLFAALSRGEEMFVPQDFEAVPMIERDVTSLATFREKRPLPLLRDVLDRLYAASDADYFIYTNVDIALQPHFYSAIKQYIEQGHDAIIINRRTIPAVPNRPEDLPTMYATVGTPHPGHDCFIFRRDLYPQFILNDVCLGIGHVDLPFVCSMIATCSSFLFLKHERLTFHLGDARSWRKGKYRDYRRHNDREAANAVLELAKRAPRRMSLLQKTLISMHLLKNPLVVREFRRMFGR